MEKPANLPIIKAQVLERINGLFYTNIYFSPLHVIDELRDKLKFNMPYNMLILKPHVIEKSIELCHPEDDMLLNVFLKPSEYYLLIPDKSGDKFNTPWE